MLCIVLAVVALKKIINWFDLRIRFEGRREFQGGAKSSNLENLLQFVEHVKQSQQSKQCITHDYKK